MHGGVCGEKNRGVGVEFRDGFVRGGFVQAGDAYGVFMGGEDGTYGCGELGDGETTCLGGGGGGDIYNKRYIMDNCRVFGLIMSLLLYLTCIHMQHRLPHRFTHM